MRFANAHWYMCMNCNRFDFAETGDIITRSCCSKMSMKGIEII
jgi:hypothetical protein